MILTIQSETKAVLNTRMTPVIMGVLPRLEGRRKWLKAGGLSLEPTPHNIEALQQSIEGLEVEQLQDHSAFEVLEAIVPRSPYKQKMPSYLDKDGNPFQDVAQSLASQKQHFGFFMEQGTGKTKVAIDRGGHLYCSGQVDAMMVISKKGVHRQWVEEQFPLHCGIPYDAHFWPVKELPSNLHAGDNLKVLTINIDGIKTKKGMMICLEFIRQHKGRVFCVIDESQDIKNKRSQRWKAADEIGRCCSHRMILTGTPVAKDLTDEWAQLAWLDPKILGIKYVSAFRNEYCVMGGFEGRVVVGHRNIERFREKVDPYTFRVTAEDIGLLPPTVHTWRFDLSAKQKFMIKSMKAALIAQIDSGEITTASNAAVRVLRMEQIANGFVVNEDKETHDIFDDHKKNPRISDLMDILAAIEGKVVIWAEFKRDVEVIAEVLGDKCVTYYGPTPDKERPINKDRFINDESVLYFVATPACAGTGTDGLQEASVNAIFYSYSENSIHFWQAKARTRRIGMMGEIASYWLMVAKGSPDAKKLRNLSKKKTISDMAIGDLRAWLTDENDDEGLIEMLNGGEF
mgnify:CR=1 FL=1